MIENWIFLVEWNFALVNQQTKKCPSRDSNPELWHNGPIFQQLIHLYNIRLSTSHFYMLARWDIRNEKWNIFMSHNFLWQREMKMPIYNSERCQDRYRPYGWFDRTWIWVIFYFNTFYALVFMLKLVMQYFMQKKYLVRN